LGAAAVGVAAPAQAFAYPAVLLDGRRVGDLILGETTLEQAVRMFPPIPPGGPGAPRPPRGYPPVKIGQVIPRPTLVYSPWMSLYQLYFDENRRLVIIVDGGQSALRGRSRAEVSSQFPQLQETANYGIEIELQGELRPCITLMVLVNTSTNTVGDIAYAHTCPTRAG
jgi:hypothetical protein